MFVATIYFSGEDSTTNEQFWREKRIEDKEEVDDDVVHGDLKKKTRILCRLNYDKSCFLFLIILGKIQM